MHIRILVSEPSGGQHDIQHILLGLRHKGRLQHVSSLAPQCSEYAQDPFHRRCTRKIMIGQHRFHVMLPAKRRQPPRDLLIRRARCTCLIALPGPLNVQHADSAAPNRFFIDGEIFFGIIMEAATLDIGADREQNRAFPEAVLQPSEQILQGILLHLAGQIIAEFDHRNLRIALRMADLLGLKFDLRLIMPRNGHTDFCHTCHPLL